MFKSVAWGLTTIYYIDRINIVTDYIIISVTIIKKFYRFINKYLTVLVSTRGWI